MPCPITRPLVEIPPAEAAELMTIALTLTRGRALQATAAREAFRVVADRLNEYFAASGIVLMRPPPRPAHSSTGMGMGGPSSMPED